MTAIDYDIEFQREIKEHALDTLWTLKDQDIETYGCELADLLTENENMCGAWVIYTARALEYIGKHIRAATDVFDELEYSGSPMNPFKDPEAFTFYMLYFGTNALTNELEYINEHWNNRITLDNETIEVLEQQIKAAWNGLE